MSSEHVLFEQKGPLGLITLNRPGALNALTPGMIDALDAQLIAWQGDASVAAVAICGAGDHFCAGGDVRMLYEGGIDNLAENADFYRREYRLNNRIKTYPKPYIALTHGVTMGGGAGVSINGKYRVATDTLVFAMPEVAIGFVPDVGGSYFLSRMPGNMGLWAGASGAYLGVADALYSHLIDYFIREERYDAVINGLASADYSDGADEAVCEVLAMNASAPDAPSLKDNAEEIDAAFSAPSIEAALAALEGGSDWAQGQADKIKAACPRSVKFAHTLIRAGAGAEFTTCLANEYRAAKAMISHPDFFEGVRAQLVDKDRSPNWADASISAVADADAQALLTPGSDEWTPA